MDPVSPPDQESRDAGIGMESTTASPDQTGNNLDSGSDQEDLDDCGTFDEIFNNENNFEAKTEPVDEYEVDTTAEPVDTGEKGRLIRQRVRNARISSMPVRTERDKFADKILGKSKRQLYEDALQAHKDKHKGQRDPDYRASKKRTQAESSDDDYDKEIENTSILAKRKRSERKQRRTQKDFSFYDKDVIIDLTGADENGVRPMSNRKGSNGNRKDPEMIKQEYPSRDAILVGHEIFIRHVHVTEDNFHKAMEKQLNTVHIDQIVRAIAFKIKSLVPKEESNEPVVELCIAFTLQYNIKKMKTWRIPIDRFYTGSTTSGSDDDIFSMGKIMQHLSAWLSDTSPNGARHFLLDNIPKGTSVNLDYGSLGLLLPAGEKTYDYIKKKLLADDEGLHTGMKVRILFKQMCTDLEKTVKIPSKDRQVEHLSTRFSFSLNADEATSSLLRASNKVVAYITISCTGGTEYCQTQCGEDLRRLDFQDHKKKISEDKICPLCDVDLVMSPGHVKCKWSIKLIMTANGDQFNHWQVLIPQANAKAHKNTCPAQRHFQPAKQKIYNSDEDD